KGCHVEISEAELSLRHCSISLQGNELVLRDADSHLGTFLDGRQIGEEAIGDGVHLVRAGSALISIEPTEAEATRVEPVRRVRDLGSRNGTFLNTLPATNTKVHSGDEIRAGVNRFRIEHRL